MIREKPDGSGPETGLARGILLLFAVLLAFGPGLYGERLADDAVLIGKAAVSGPLDFEFWWPGYYNFRPNFLSQAFFWFDYRCHGNGLTGYRLSNLVLHFLVCLLFARLLCRLKLDAFTVTAATFLFALHPARCENVSWISGRQDLVCALFLLAALERAAAGREWAAAACGLLACAGKETAILLPLFDLALRGWDAHRSRSFQLFVLVAAGWGLLRFGVYGVQPINDARLGLAGIAQTLLLYPAITVIPGLCAYPQSISHAGYLSLLAGFLVLVAAPLLLTDGPGRRGTLFFFLALLPVSGIVSVPDFLPHADRFLYVPGLGAALWLARLLARAPGRRPLLLLLAGLLLLATAQRADLFTEYGALIQDAALRFPGSEAVAFVEARRGYPAHAASALASARRACRLDPYGNPHFYDRVFDLELELGLIGEARATLELLEGRFPPRPGTLERRGELAAWQGRDDEARVAWREALQLEPRAAAITHRLALSLARSGNDEALVLCRRACHLAPWRPHYWNSLAILCLRRADMPGAWRAWQWAARLLASSLRPDHRLVSSFVAGHLQVFLPPILISRLPLPRLQQE